jgi:hypothetical protein
MKKSGIIVAALLVGGVVTSWAQETDRILAGPLPITFKGKLSDKTAVSGSTLATAAGGGSLEVAEVQYVGGAFTGTPFSVIGTSIGLTNLVSGSSTDVDLVGTDLYEQDGAVDLSKAGSKTMKFVSAWSETGFDLFTSASISNLSSTITNSVLILQGTSTETATGTNLNAKVLGIWVAGKTAVTGTIKSEKTKKVKQ